MYGTNPVALMPTRDGRDDDVRIEQLVIPHPEQLMLYANTMHASTRALPKYILAQYTGGYYRILLDQQSYITKGVQVLMTNHSTDALNTIRAPTPYSAVLSTHIGQTRCRYPVDMLSSTDKTRYRAILDFLYDLATNSRPDLAYTTAMLLQAWHIPSLPLLRSAEHALIYLWQTRTLSLSCPAYNVQPDNAFTATFTADMVNARITTNAPLPPMVSTIHALPVKFNVAPADMNTSTANGASMPHPPAKSPQDTSDTKPPSTLNIQLQFFTGICDFLTKPLDVELFNNYRDQAMGHAHTATDF